MLKRRIIPIELLWGDRLVKTRNFDKPRDVGDPIKSSKVYSDQDADELLLLQIDRDFTSPLKLSQIVKQISEHCFVPLSVGGRITHFEDVALLFEAGADKVLINTIAYSKPNVISEIAQCYGNQALVIGIDVRNQNGQYALYADCGRQYQNKGLEEHISEVISAGAGEIMIQNIDRDGIMNGYELELLQRVVNVSSVPVIAAAGAGNFLHIKQAFDVGVDAAACGSLFNFGDNNPLRAKAYLKNYSIPLKRI